ncbi:MAG: nuclear transport factor 2 family protein [bacterium]
MRNVKRSLVVLLVLASFASFAQAQTTDAEGRAVIAVADSVLAALSSGDNAMLARLTLDSAVVGGAGMRNGVERASLRSWALYINRKGPSEFTERGFEANVHVQDRVAQVWMPYDLYVGDKWSHCGVDTFTLMKSEGRWRVAALIYTIEQPPACRKHPSGPPSR